LTAARQWLKAGKADCLICFDSDRLSREPVHYMILRDELKDLGIELHYSKRGRIDLNDFGAMVGEDIFGRFAYEWKRKLIQLTRDGRREKVLSGNVVIHAHPPYGYALATVDGLQMLVIEPGPAEIVRSVFFGTPMRG
jgi:DNA invertase Pin-like site-specific DNA recombinase